MVSIPCIALALAAQAAGAARMEPAPMAMSAAEHRAAARYVAAIGKRDRGRRPGLSHHVQDHRPLRIGGTSREIRLDPMQISRLLADCDAQAPEKYQAGWLVVPWKCRSGELKGEQVISQVEIARGAVVQASLTIGPIPVRTNPLAWKAGHVRTAMQTRPAK
jgi:hypothetical protein